MIGKLRNSRAKMKGRERTKWDGEAETTKKENWQKLTVKKLNREPVRRESPEKVI